MSTKSIIHQAIRDNFTRHKGFTLVEVLIAMVLALVTFIIMFQMFESWDKRKRTSSSGSDSQVTGAIAMYKLERDIRLGGFGFSGTAQNVTTASLVKLNCTVHAYNNDRPTKAFTFPLLPVEIISPANNAPQQLAVLYGGSEEEATTVASLTAGNHPYAEIPDAHTKKMEIGAQSGIRIGDRAILAPNAAGQDCYMIQVTNNTDVGVDTPVQHTSGATAATRYNDPAGVIGANVAPGALYVMGMEPQRRLWQIVNRRSLAYENQLQWIDTYDNSTGAATPDNLNDLQIVADNIVDLRAQYGVAPSPVGGTCAATAGATGITWTSTLPATGCLRFIWAIRVGLLIRSEQYEKAKVTPNAPTWAGGTFVMRDLDDDPSDGVTDSNTTDDPNNWRYYRYNVMQSVIPLKNMMWGARL